MRVAQEAGAKNEEQVSPTSLAVPVLIPEHDEPERRQSTTNRWLQNRVVWANQDQWYTKTVVDGLLCWEDINMCIVMVTPVTEDQNGN